MSLVAEERILVVPTSLFHDLGYFQGFSRDIDRYWPRLVEGDHVEYRARGEMEEDPSFKQLIPYCCSAGPTPTATHTCSNTNAAAAAAKPGCTPSAASASAATSRRSTPKSATCTTSTAKACAASSKKK